jgi:dTDP-4-dehydrorhamnose 3,5-epimerase
MWFRCSRRQVPTIFVETQLKGAFIIELQRLEDNRGFFARSFCQREFEAHELNTRVAQCNVSFNRKKGTLRGLHFQDSPYQEAKLVRCTSGAIYDVIIDLREPSPTFKQWVATELSRDNHRILYVPEGFAHGYQTLKDNTEVSYQVSEFYHPDYARSIRWDDPTFAVKWPVRKKIMSDNDRNAPMFHEITGIASPRGR